MKWGDVQYSALAGERASFLLHRYYRRVEALENHIARIAYDFEKELGGHRISRFSDTIRHVLPTDTWKPVRFISEKIYSDSSRRDVTEEDIIGALTDASANYRSGRDMLTTYFHLIRTFPDFREGDTNGGPLGFFSDFRGDHRAYVAYAAEQLGVKTVPKL